MTFKREIIQPTDGSGLICTTCGGDPKPYDSFYLAKPGSMNHRTYGGFAMPCKECNRARCRAKGRSGPTKDRDRIRRSTEEYKENQRTLKRKQYAENPKPFNERNRSRYANLSTEKREVYLAKCRANSSAPEARARAAEQLKGRRKTPEFKAAHTAWNRKRRIAKRGIETSLTAQDWLECIAAYGRECIYCETVCENPTMDHVIPLADGGTHTKDNVVPACLRCNCSKQDSDVDRFLSRNQINRRRYLTKRTLGLFRLLEPRSWDHISQSVTS